MPERTYERVRARIRVTRGADRDVLLRFGRTTTHLSADDLLDLQSGWYGGVKSQLVSDGLETWWLRHLARMQSRLGRLSWETELLPVIELTVSLELAGVPWEEVLDHSVQSSSLPRTALVRPTDVPSRSSAWPLGLPIRILQVGTTLPPLERRVSQLFRLDEHDAELALRPSSCGSHDLSQWWANTRWPSVEVLELGFPPLADPVAALSMADADQVWTAGWIERLSQDLRCRLVVLAAAEAGTRAVARQIGHRLAARGGPAVLVVPPSDAEWLQGFYGDIVHDRPLDWAAARHAPGTNPEIRPAVTLIGGARREDALRVSAAFRPTVELSRRVLSAPFDQLIDLPSIDILTQASQLSSTRELVDRWRDASPDLLAEWERSSFTLHETEGVLPMQRAVHRLRETLKISGLTGVESMAFDERYFVPRLAQDDTNGVSRTVPQIGNALVGHEPVTVSVGVGQGDDLIRVAGAIGIVEEAVFRTPEEDGAWLDVAVVGLTARVVGEQVQRLWLPRTGASELASFLIDQRAQGAWRIRLCIYYQNRLLQTILVGAVNDRVEEQRERREALARVLAIGMDEIPEETTWYARTEYSLTPDEVTLTPGSLPRALSITANVLEGSRVLMLKGPDLAIEVRLPGDVDTKVQAVRGQLTKISTPPVPGSHPDDWLYGFGDDNSDTQGRGAGALQALAWRGWTLYEQLVPRHSRDALSATLEAAVPGGWWGSRSALGSVINVGHLLIDHVIPWAMVYDRPYDKRKRHLQSGEPVEHVACLAQDAGYELPERCGEHALCPLNPGQIQARRVAGRPLVDESTVACPRHFWGYRHVIEIPPTRRVSSAATIVGDKGAVRAGFALHRGLTKVEAHLSSLATAVEQLGHVAWREGNRDALKNRLTDDLDIDIVYFYCHAGMDETDEVIRVQGVDDPSEGLLGPADLAGSPFRKHPLIFVNGCRTVGFSPKTLSPFITTLVTDRDASGLIGAEIDVWEQLATEVGWEFIQRFLGAPGISAGRALRETRLKLLAKGNPLGLVYTLYGLADLHVRP